MATLTASGYETFAQACKQCHMWLLDALPVLSANMYLQVPMVDYLLSYTKILVHPGIASFTATVMARESLC